MAGRHPTVQENTSHAWGPVEGQACQERREGDSKQRQEAEFKPEPSAPYHPSPLPLPYLFLVCLGLSPTCRMQKWGCLWGRFAGLFPRSPASCQKQPLTGLKTKSAPLEPETPQCDKSTCLANVSGMFQELCCLRHPSTDSVCDNQCPTVRCM